jgi:hypothetical protein
MAGHLDASMKQPANLIDRIKEFKRLRIEQVSYREARAEAAFGLVWQLYGLYFVFLGTVFSTVAQGSNISCRKLWSCLSLVCLATFAFASALIHTLQKYNTMKLGISVMLISKRSVDLLLSRVEMAVERGDNPAEFEDEFQVLHNTNVCSMDFPRAVLVKGWITLIGILIFTLAVASLVCLSSWDMLCN